MKEISSIKSFKNGKSGWNIASVSQFTYRPQSFQDVSKSSPLKVGGKDSEINDGKRKE